MIEDDEFKPVSPWAMPAREDCLFYHVMNLPDGELIEGVWDIRNRFDQYIGHYPIRGKSLLDVGTASGFLAFEAEKAGATVTAHDGLRGSEFHLVPRGGTPYHLDRRGYVAQYDAWLTTLRNGFWYSWHRLQSRVEMVYAPLARFPWWNRSFDVVLAGAILEHLPDPVTVIADMSRLAREAVIIAYTPVLEESRQIMETANDWSQHDITFWTLSKGLYRRIFDNLGFDVEFLTSTARTGGHDYERATIVARRRR